MCDDAYTRDDLLKMERDILKVLNYDVNMPIAYRFLRRLARVSAHYHPSYFPRARFLTVALPFVPFT